MLRIKQQYWFDLNKLGILLVSLMLVIGFFLVIDVEFKLMFNGLLIIISFYLYKRIQKNQEYSIMVNNENLWFLTYNDKSIAVDLKDYWIQSERIFIWLKGSNKSLSFMVSRRIIGVELFSQLRTKMI
jgi:hypothetical protein